MFVFVLAGISLLANPVPAGEEPVSERRISTAAQRSAEGDPGDAAAAGKAITPVRAINLASMFGHDNYPPAAFTEHRQGRVEIVAQIGTDGKATSCTVVTSSSHADLDAAACEGVYKALFFPATDHKGEPVSDTFTTAITWSLVP